MGGRYWSEEIEVMFWLPRERGRTGRAGLYVSESRAGHVASRRGPLAELRAAPLGGATYYLSLEVALEHGDGADGRWSWYHAKEIGVFVVEILHPKIEVRARRRLVRVSFDHATNLAKL